MSCMGVVTVLHDGVGGTTGKNCTVIWIVKDKCSRITTNGDLASYGSYV